MSLAGGAESLTESSTRFEPIDLGSGWLANIIALEGLWIRGGRKGWPPAEADLVLMTGSSKYTVLEIKRSGVPTSEDVASLASSLEKVDRLSFYSRLRPRSSAGASSNTATERSGHQLQRARRRNELLQRLTPERRATYERIKKLREEIGPLSFDVVEELRELRENG